MAHFATLLLAVLFTLPLLADDSTPPSGSDAQPPQTREQAQMLSPKMKKKVKRQQRAALTKKAQALRADTGPKTEGSQGETEPAPGKNADKKAASGENATN